MLVTDLAMRDMERQSSEWFGWIRRIMGRLWRPWAASLSRATTLQFQPRPAHLTLIPKPLASPAAPQSSAPDLQEKTMPADTSSDTAFRWRRHPQLRNRPGAAPGDTAAVARREARSSAIRGLFLARGGQLQEARAAFAIAARDEAIDLTAIPGFWTLSRGAMLAAAAAYDDVGRFRDSSALAAQIRTTYRPRAVTPNPTQPRRNVTASGG